MPITRQLSMLLQTKPESEGYACEGNPLLTLFGPEQVHVPFGTEYKHIVHTDDDV